MYWPTRFFGIWVLFALLLSAVACAFAQTRSTELNEPEWKAIVSDPPFCTPLPFPGSEQNVVTIDGGDVHALLWYVRHSSPHTILLLEDGVYRFAQGQHLEVSVPWLTIRSVSGNRDGVILEGGNTNITISASGVTIADITLQQARFHGIQIRGERGVAYARIYNVHVVDSGQQLIKVSTGDGKSGLFADHGLLACSLLDYTTYAKGTDGSAPSYTDGIDILAGKGWVIRDNEFRRIRSQAGPAGPAILVWKNALDTVIVRNVIIDCWRGIALGLMAPNAHSRGGADVLYDHQNGLVENNVILALREPADAAIENSYAFNSRVRHNTVFYNPEIRHAVDWAIEYRYPPTTAVIINNLTNLPIRKRSPSPLENPLEHGNVTEAKASWFRDVWNGDIHLMSGVYPIDHGVRELASEHDIDGGRRPVGHAPDVGADEFGN